MFHFLYYFQYCAGNPNFINHSLYGDSFVLDILVVIVYILFSLFMYF